MLGGRLSVTLATIVIRPVMITAYTRAADWTADMIHERIPLCPAFDPHLHETVPSIRLSHQKTNVNRPYM